VKNETAGHFSFSGLSPLGRNRAFAMASDAATGNGSSGLLSKAVERDYELVQECLGDRRRGFAALTVAMGKTVQPSTKSAGYGSTTRGFYARSIFLAEFIKLY
jgi:hypothetical protein